MDNKILISQEDITTQIIQNTNDISKLKSNIKWIYQYGGVGGNGSGGSGTSDEWGLYVTLNGKILAQDTEEEKEVILDSNSPKNLIIQINKPNGKTYYINDITYFNGEENYHYADKVMKKSDRTLQPGKYKLEINNLNIKGNESLKIEIICNEDNNSHYINYKCITNPLSNSISFVYKEGSNYYPISTNTIDVNKLRESDGLYIKLNYTFYTISGYLYYQIIQSTLNIENVNFNRIQLDKKTDTIYFKFDIDYNEYSNLGYHMFSLNLIVDEDGEETIIPNTISCTIIPNEMYLQVMPSNTKQIIYNHPQENMDNLYTFISGIHAFNLTPYSGSNQITNNKFSISCIKREQDDINNIILPKETDFYSSNKEFIQDVNILTEVLSTNIQERVTNTHQINLVLNNQDNDIHLITLSFMMKYNNEFSKIQTIYIYVVKNESTINWYKNEINEATSEYVNLNYFRSGTCLGDFNYSSKFKSSQYLQFRQTDNEQTLLNLSNLLNANNVVIHIGLQFSDINDEDKKIIELIDANGKNITLYQNKLMVGTASSKIFIPKENNYNPSKHNQYHLISILKNKLYDDVYAITIYIDGVIENSIETLYSSTDIFSFTSIKTYKSNFAINLLEVSYIKEIKMSDNDISRYWDAYFDQFILSSTEDKELIASINADKIIANYIDNISFTKDNFIELKNTSDSQAFTLIDNIALSINTPVLLIDYDNKIDNKYDNFVDWFTRTYGENETVESKPVSIYYSPGNKSLGDKIDTFTNTTFYIEPQGSSTLGVRAKNLNLGIRNTSTLNTVPVFTPNFSLEDPNTFLPESKFTLKADHVDSSHSNNTSIGKFINENTMKFSQASAGDNNSVYINHIKNCLLGFPILVFVKVRINEPESDDIPDSPENYKYYYLGIYNFNLGRDSYFNMGYYPLLHNNQEVFNDSLKNNNGNFSLYQLNNDVIEYKNGLIITEIQGGNEYFDFSEYDDTILFQVNNKNKKYMFGDHVPEIYDYREEKIQEDGTLLTTDIGARNKQLITKLVKNIAITGGLLFKELEKNFGPHSDGYNASVNTSDKIYESKNQVPDFTQQWVYDWSKDTIDDHSRAYTQSVEKSTEMENVYNTGNLINYLNELIKYDVQNEDDPTPIPLLDYRSLVEYYVACMVFGLVDSVQKNLNLKSWNATRAENPATFYTAFYDMDTCLGRDNGGEEVKYFAFSDYWKSTIENDKLSEITIYRDFYPVRNEQSNVPIGYDIPSSYLFAIAKYARISIPNTTYNNSKYPSPNMIYSMWRNSTKGSYGQGSLKNAKEFVDKYFNTLKNIPTSLINHNYRFKYLMINKSNNSYSYDTARNKKPFHGRGVYSVIDWLSNRLRLLDAYFNLAKIETKVQKYDITNREWNIVYYNHDSNNIPLSLNEYNDGNFIYTPDTNNEDIYILSDIFGKSSKLNKVINLEIKSSKWSPIVITTPLNSQQFLVPEDDKKFTIMVKPSGNNTLILGGSQYWTYVSNLGGFVEDNGITINSKTLTNISLNYNISGNPSSWVFNTPSVITINLNNPQYTGILKNYDTTDNDLLLNLIEVSLANSRISVDFKNNGFQSLNISNTISERGININNCNNFNNLIYDSNTNISELNISHIWKEDINLSSFTCEKISITNSNENLYNDPSIVIDNITNLKEIVLSANFKKIKISNCNSLEKIILPNNVEELQIINVNLKKLFENSESSNIENNIVFKTDNLGNNIIDISYLSELNIISFENTKDFHTIILPNKDIELKYKAFAETDLTYIDFADKQNKNHTLILCDNASNNLEAGDDCSIFYNSRFALLSSYIQDLEFKVKEKNTSLNNLFYITRKNNSLGVHNGVANITYTKAQKFIKDLGNKDKVISYDYAFHRQENIIATYKSTNNQEYEFDGNNYSEIYNELNNVLISFNGYTNLKSVYCTFEHTLINFMDNYIFGGTFAENVEEEVNILNVLPYNILSYMHFNALDNIKNKIKKFIFDGQDDLLNYRNKYQNKLFIYGGESIININVHDLLFNNDNSKLEILSGFRISNQTININGLFTEKEKSIRNIHDSFNNLNQSIDTNGGNLYNINNFTLKDLTNLSVLDNSFVGVKVDSDKLDPNKTIDILSYLDWENQFKNLQSYIENNNQFNFYKHVNLISDNDKEKWKEFWTTINGVSENISLNYVFSQCIFKMNDPLVIQNNDDSNLSSIIRVNGLFKDSICYKGNTDENIGFTLSENTLKNLVGVKYADNMFNGCTLNGTTNYPIPENLLQNLTSLISCKNMFANTKILGDHKTYKNGIRKQIYYENGGINTAHNYSINSTNSITYDNEYGYVYGYPFVPPTLFKNNKELTDISEIFSNSDFEGYLPDNLLNSLLDEQNNSLSKLKNINKFIYNCKILPQIYHKFEIGNIIKGIYFNNPDEINDNTITNIIAYTFIPDGFIGDGHINLINNDIFNFKLLASFNIFSRLYLFTNKSFGESIKLENINLVIDDTSRIIPKYYKDDSSGNWDAETELNNVDTYIIGYINLCINNYNPNTYTEGINIKLWDSINKTNICLINQYLANLYYGYIFEPNTLLYNNSISISASNSKYFIDMVSNIYKPGDSMNSSITIERSCNIIFPSIIYYNTSNEVDEVIDNMNMINNYYYDKPIQELYNRYYKKCLLNIGIPGQCILEDTFDMSFIETMTYDIQNDDINQQYIGKATYTYNGNNRTFEFINKYDYSEFGDKTYEDIEIEIKKNLKNCLKQMVYNNYYLLFNKYSDIVNIQILDNNTGSFILSPYKLFTIDNDKNNSSFVLLKSIETIDQPEDQQSKLYRDYRVACKQLDDNSIVITNITKNS